MIWLSVLVWNLKLYNCVALAQTIHQCLRDTAPVRGASVVDTWSINNATYRLMHSPDGVDWCQSFRICSQRGLHLSESIGNTSNLLAGDSDSLWISGRRKDFGRKWTWVNENLHDLDETSVNCKVKLPEEIQDGQYPYGKALLGSSFCEIDNKAEFQSYSICRNEPIASDQQITWIEAQGECYATDGGRLATLDDIGSRRDLDVHSYWIGLAYRPWIWVRRCNHGSECFSPIIKFMNHIRPGIDEDCLSVAGSSGTWRTLPCSSTLHYFVCAGEIRTTSDTLTTHTTSPNVHIFSTTHADVTSGGDVTAELELTSRRESVTDILQTDGRMASTATLADVTSHDHAADYSGNSHVTHVSYTTVGSTRSTSVTTSRMSATTPSIFSNWIGIATVIGIGLTVGCVIASFFAMGIQMGKSKAKKLTVHQFDLEKAIQKQLSLSCNSLDTVLNPVKSSYKCAGSCTMLDQHYSPRRHNEKQYGAEPQATQFLTVASVHHPRDDPWSEPSEYDEIRYSMFQKPGSKPGSSTPFEMSHIQPDQRSAEKKRSHEKPKYLPNHFNERRDPHDPEGRFTYDEIPSQYLTTISDLRQTQLNTYGN